MILNQIKLGLIVTFMEYPASAVSLIFLTKNFNLKENDVSSIKLSETL